jgi:SSS family solute:Na+ symporter
VNAALPFIAAAALLALALGFLASRGKDMNLEQWTVGGRGFGALFVFLLLAGEIYTTFTFLGGSGFAYGKGAPAYYILCYGTLAYVLSYFMLPPIWRYAKEHRLYSQSDFFVRKYESPTLGVIVSLVDIVALIPYLVLQFKGLGIIVEIAGYGAISSTAAIWIGAVVVAAYVMVSGVHGSAWTSVAKDTLILVIVVFLGIYLPYHYYGGLGPMFTAIEHAKPGFTVFSPHGESLWWSASTVLLTALGFYMWPHTFASIYTAKGARVIRKNAIVLPLYQLILLFVFFVGFAATLQVPGLTGSDIDLALFKLSVKTFDPWFVGVIGATGVFTALVPGSMILITAATLIANNLYRAVDRSADDTGVGAGQAPGAGGGGRGGVLHPEGWADHRGASADGLQPGDSVVPAADPEPGAQQHRDPRGRRGRHHRRGRHRGRAQPHRREPPHAALAAGAGPGSQHRHRRPRREFRDAHPGEPRDPARDRTDKGGRGVRFPTF